MLKKEITAVLLAATFFLNLVAPVGAASIDDKQAELESIRQQLYNKDVEREILRCLCDINAYRDKLLKDTSPVSGDASPRCNSGGRIEMIEPRPPGRRF